MTPPGLFGADRSADEQPIHFEAFAKVSVERGGNAGATPLTYGCQDTIVTPGQRVTVPLGRGNTTAEGVVLEVGGPELLDGFDPARVKPILEASGDPLPPDLVELAGWVSRYYACPLGVVLGSIVPASVKARTGERKVTQLVPAEGVTPGIVPDQTSLAPSASEAWSKLDASILPATPRAIADALEHKTVAAVNRLVRAGLLVETKRTTVRERGAFTSHRQSGQSRDTPPDLTTEQAAAVNTINANLDDHRVTLLQGVTGSGKTEVYLRVIERVLAAGRSAIVLVPEISLTPQTSQRFVRRFGTVRVAVLHSALSRSERYGQWRRAAEGDARVIVGARSAVFAPAVKLGLIVIDEEHDSSYKQDQAPRYHARDVAVVRARRAGIPVLLGSATPSLESYDAATSGRATHLKLTSRPGGGRLPRVEIIDLAEERRRDPEAKRRLRAIGPRLDHALRTTLESGSQAVLFVNRRGFATHLHCPSCDWFLGCDRCSTRLVIHEDRSLAKGQYARCHHCHAEVLRPELCPDCSKRLVGLGIGTQRLEAELAERYAGLDFGDGRAGLVAGETFERIDTDNTRAGRALFETLERFGSGELRLLVGTQMIAKGLDFPGVRLVGVVDADTALSLPDFRATERTFQLVSQVAGRSGRRDGHGLVIVQTNDPTAPAITHAANHDFDAFAREELDLRRRFELPPTWRMARIVSRDKDARVAEQANTTIADRARRFESENLRVVGPAECVLARINEHFRFATEITASDPRHLQAVIRELVARGDALSDAKTAIDVDPVSLL